MSRILVVDDDLAIRRLLVDTLSDAGYDVIEAKHGGEALEKVGHQRPDLILLDVWMPVMDGLQVLEKLREDSTRQAIPVVILTALAAVEGEHEAMRLGVNHYLTKPWNPGILELTVKVALREAEAATNGARDDGSTTPQGSTSNASKPQGVIGTADLLIPLEKKLEGGIPLGSLTLVEGASTAGKSVLCQHLVYGALMEKHGVAYFTSEYKASDLVTQMGSIGLSVAKYVQEDELCIYPVQEPINGEGGSLMAALALDIEHLSPKYEFIVVDAISNLASYSQDQSIMGFFSSCKRLCNQGRTIVVVAHSYALNESLLNRLHALCDAYLRLRVAKFRKLVRMVEVAKANNIELNRDNIVSFQVVPGAGMQIIAFNQTKV